MELIDIYREDGTKTGKTQDRAVPLSPGEYQLGAIIVVVNRMGDILLTLRSPQKKVCPNVWESTGGGAVSGETAEQAAVRELMEETGISADKGELTYLYRVRAVSQADGRGLLNEVFAMHRELDIASLTLQPEEVSGAKWVSYDEWERRARCGEILTPAGPADEKFFSILKSYIEHVKKSNE